MKNLCRSISIVGFALFSATAASRGATITTDGSAAGVQAALNRAQAGDTVVLPQGKFTWSTPIVGKTPVKLTGSGQRTGGTGSPLSGGTIIEDANPGTYGFTLTLTGGSLTNIAFVSSSSGGTGNAHVRLVGNTPLVSNCYFETGTDGTYRSIDWDASGGVCWSSAFWSHQRDNNAIRLLGTTPWQSVGSYGTADVSGTTNVYIEDCTFTDIYLQAIDSDQWSRVVIRHNTFKNSALTNHGDTDQGLDGSGSRQEEIYNNTFTFNSGSNGCNGIDSSGYPLNLNYWLYVRSGTFVMWGNSLPDISACWIGDKSTTTLLIQKLRRDAGTYACWSGGYPAPFQPGWGSDGKSIPSNLTSEGIKQSLDPIYIWGNTGGSKANSVALEDYSPNQCSSNAPSVTSYIVQGREYILGVAKPNYKPYTYPHPLRGGTSSSTTAPSPTPTPSPSPTPVQSSTPAPTPTPTTFAYSQWETKLNSWMSANGFSAAQAQTIDSFIQSDPPHLDAQNSYYEWQGELNWYLQRNGFSSSTIGSVDQFVMSTPPQKN